MRWTMAGEPDRGDGLEDVDVGVATRTRPRTKKPSNYKVLMLNDDYTPMEFVVLVHLEHHPGGILDVHREEALEHQDDELHRSIIVVEHQDLVVGRLFGARAGARGDPGLADPAVVFPFVAHRPTHNHSITKIWQAANA